MSESAAIPTTPSDLPIVSSARTYSSTLVQLRSLLRLLITSDFSTCKLQVSSGREETNLIAVARRAP